VAEINEAVKMNIEEEIKGDMANRKDMEAPRVMAKMKMMIGQKEEEGILVNHAEDLHRWILKNADASRLKAGDIRIRVRIPAEAVRQIEAAHPVEAVLRTVGDRLRTAEAIREGNKVVPVVVDMVAEAEAAVNG